MIKIKDSPAEWADQKDEVWGKKNEAWKATERCFYKEPPNPEDMWEGAKLHPYLVFVHWETLADF